jgi:hypothetical protein
MNERVDHDQSMSDLDLSRLCLFVALHEGHWPDIPHGVVETYRRLAAFGLVALIEEDVEIPTGCDVHNYVRLVARITPSGRGVVSAMLDAAREILRNV